MFNVYCYLVECTFLLTAVLLMVVYCVKTYTGRSFCGLNKESSKGSLLMSFSFRRRGEHKLHLHYFHWRIWLLQRVLINVQLRSPCFHFAKVDNLNSRGFLKPNSVLVLPFFFFPFLNSVLIIYLHNTQKKLQYVFSFCPTPCWQVWLNRDTVFLCAVAHNLDTSK